MLAIALLVLACARPPDDAEPDDPVDLIAWVDPLIGTGGFGYGVGSGTPAATRPFGLVKAGPDTSDQYGASFGVYRGGGYHYDDVHIEGFSHMHLHGVGGTDYGLVALMPSDGFDASRTSRPGYRAVFRHEDETVEPGRYAVRLDDPAVQVDIVAGTRTALHRYAFEASVAQPTLILDVCHTLGDGVCLSGQVSLDPEAGTVRGEALTWGDLADPFPVWFTAVFDPPPVAWGTWTEGELREGATAAMASAGPASLWEQPDEGASLGAWLRFDARTVRVRVALSTTDAAGAEANLAAEHDDFDQDAELTEARTAWETVFAPIRVWGGTEDQRRIFATALYHTHMMPTLWSDADGRYRGFDRQVHEDGPYWTDFSLWDTYRTVHPLYTLLWPDTHRALLGSLARMAEQGGALPRWPIADWDGGFMVGTPAAIVAAEAWIKGLRDFGEDSIFPAAVAVATGAVDAPYGAPPDVATLEATGWYPADVVGTSVANLQELNIADAALAAAEGAPGVDAATAAHLAERSGWWANVWDPEVGFFHARLSDGSFDDFPSESAWLDEYAEGNARQYLWLVPQDPEGLFATLGGEEAAVARLEAFFEGARAEYEAGEDGLPDPYYWHGNEADLHAAWLFALAGRPDLTREWVRWIEETQYGTGADGLAGNDDAGTLSAWYVWAAIGLYPLAGSDRYVLGDPLFDRVEIDREDGTTLVIERLGGGEVEAVRVDGEPWEAPDIRHAELAAASTLTFCAGGC